MDNKIKIHDTKVRVNLDGLAKVLPLLYEDWKKIGTRDKGIGRSKFTTWNNLQHFYDRNVMNKQDDGTVTVMATGSQSGSTARVYYTPSVTSLAKVFRKFIVPCNDQKVFAYADIKGAEFFLNCLFCNETEAINTYYMGGDIYMHYKGIFPAGCERPVIKQALIGYMYGLTPYTLAKKTGVSEAYAERMLMLIDRNLPKMRAAKHMRIEYARTHNGYFCPAFENGKFNQDKLVKVADIDPKKGFQENLALSAYIQSALGEFMQNFIQDVEKRVDGTILTVFDSVFVEMWPDSIERFKNYLAKAWHPFLFDEVKTGKTMYEAQEGD